MNSIIMDTNVKENCKIMDKHSIIGTSENGSKIIVRTKDFYPCLCSQKEYTELDIGTYNMLSSFKRIAEEAEPDKNDNRTENDEDVSADIVEELLKYRVLENGYNKETRNETVSIKLSDFYPNNCSDEEYCEVSRKVYEELMKNKREDNAIRVSDQRHIESYCFDEIKCGELEGIYTDSNEKIIDLIILLRNLLAPYGEKYVRRGVMYYINGETPASIAMLENVTRDAVWKSLKRIKRIVQIAGTEYFGLTVPVGK